jgi:hypothetical protein
VNRLFILTARPAFFDHRGLATRLAPIEGFLMQCEAKLKLPFGVCDLPVQIFFVLTDRVKISLMPFVNIRAY